MSSFSNIIATTRKSFPSFGGVMMWDASQAYGELFIFLRIDHGTDL